MGTEAIFMCKFSSVSRPYWYVNTTDASVASNIGHLLNDGIFVEQEHEDGPNVTLTLRVNSSYPAVNNTKLQCKTYSNIETHVATVTTIARELYNVRSYIMYDYVLGCTNFHIRKGLYVSIDA